MINLLSSKREDIIDNAVLITVNRCTKMIKYLSMIIKIDVAKLLKLFFKKIVLRFDMLIDIISDKNFLFINAF